MKRLLMFIICFWQTGVFAQDSILVKDLDADQVMDSVYIESSTSRIICVLSSQQFKRIASLEIEILGDQSSLHPTKSGFEFSINWMRAGGSSQFRYDPALKKIQLIGMSRYDFGNAANDGSGKSSVNLLSHKYSGDWYYFDELKDKLIKMPTIQTGMHIPKTYLEDYTDAVYQNYTDQCDKLSNDSRKKIKQ